MMKSFLLTVIFCATASGAQPEDVAPKSIPAPGYYKVRGSDPKGDVYTAVATVVKMNRIYVVTWINGSGPVIRGSGLLVGDKLAVGWSLPGTNVAGCTLYTVEPGGRLMRGRWTAGAGQVCNETMTFFAEFDEDE